MFKNKELKSFNINYIIYVLTNVMNNVYNGLRTLML